MDFIDGVLEPSLWFLADWSLRWGLLIAMLAVALILARPQRAATRYLVCLLTVLAGLALPALPRWGKGLAIAPTRSQPTSIVTAHSADNSASPTSVGHGSLKETKEEPRNFAPMAPDRASANDSPSPSETERTSESFGLRRIAIVSLAIIWILGAGLLFARRLGGWLLLERMRRTAVPIQGQAFQVFQSCAAQLALRRSATLASHGAVHSPITLGLHRPMILVPLSWPELPEHVQRASLLHELAHLARFDDWSALALELVRTVFFFHPLVHWILGRIEYERELLCDEMVIGLGIDPREYAGVLLEFSRQAGRLRPAFVGPSYPLGFGHRRTVKARIHRLLEANMNRWMSPLPVGRAIALGTLVLGLALALGSFRAGAIETDSKESPTPGPPARAVPQVGDESPNSTPVANQEGAKATKAAAEPPTKDKRKKEPFIYGGKSFADWQAVLTTDLKPEVRLEAIKALSTFGANGYGKEAADAIIQAMRGYDIGSLDTDDGRVTEAATLAFRKIGSEGVASLLLELKHGNKNGRRFAIQALNQVQDRADIVPTLIAAFKDEDLFIRRFALGCTLPKDANPKLFVPTLTECLKDADPQSRLSAAYRLREIGQNAKPAVPALIATIKDNDPKVRHAALNALQSMGIQTKDVLPALLAAMRDENRIVRLAAFQVVEKLGPEAKDAIPGLLASFKDADYIERTYIARALGSIGPAAKEAVPTLLDIMAQPQTQESGKAVQDALRKISK